MFWGPGLVAMPRDEWTNRQQRIVTDDRWIMDGDLGRYDTPQVRLRMADTIIFLDFSIHCVPFGDRASPLALAPALSAPEPPDSHGSHC